MGGTLVLWTSFLSVMVWNVHGVPAKGLNGPQPQAQPGPEGINPVDSNDVANMAGWYWEGHDPVDWSWMESPISDNDDQQPGPPPPQAPGAGAAAEPDPATSWGFDPEPVPLHPSVPDPDTILVPQYPPGPPAPPEPFYKPGKVIRLFSIYEHGNDESEFHDSGDLIPPPPPHLPFPVSSEDRGPEVSSYVSPPLEEHDDQFFQMFLAGELPPGTITHFSSTYEHGHNAWTDVGFERIPVRSAQAPTPHSTVKEVDTPVKIPQHESETVSSPKQTW
ncbi:leucine-rich repeat extensin-like protein 5 [Alosa sapidissima]|uniref:leucine-rich repeat extensin-like protein 5 n=1 Tax=Alosa sapidissima TaxID=34773 RepID=UPI001C0A56C5|nr:leucine-rich repeat extensin-like protein 5 [Alosa sapidissima]